VKHLDLNTADGLYTRGDRRSAGCGAGSAPRLQVVLAGGAGVSLISGIDILSIFSTE